MIATIRKALDLLIPRFIEEDVALIDVGDHYEILCSFSDVELGERVDAVVTMRSFNLFGRALWPKMIGEPRLLWV